MDTNQKEVMFNVELSEVGWAVTVEQKQKV